MEYHQRRIGQKPQVRKKRVFTPADEEEVASPHYTGHSAGIHPEDTPYLTMADVRSHLPMKQTGPEQDPEDYEAGSFITAIARRYNGIQMPDGVMVRAGNDQVYFHNSPPPVQRASRGKNATTQYQIPQEATTPHQPVQRRPGRLYWALFLGIGLLVMLIGYVGFSALSAWWQVHTDDGTYGRPRTFQIDAVVGHGDSAQHPSHFIAINLNGHIIIVEIPGGDISRSVIYSGGVLVGNNDDLTPVTLSFADANHDGKVDMLVHIADQTIIFLNNGSKFVPPPNLVSGESNLPTKGE